MPFVVWPVGLLMILVGAVLVIASTWPTRPQRNRDPATMRLWGLFPPWIGGLWWLLVGGAVLFVAWSPIPLSTQFASYVMVFIHGAWLGTLVVTAIVHAITRSRTVK